MVKISKKQRMILETNELLKHFDAKLKNKIPPQVLTIFEMLSRVEYNFVYDETKPLSEQNISEDTKDMISYLYIKYCCDANEKQEIYNIIKSNKEKRVQLDREKNWLLNKKYEEIENESNKIDDETNVTETALVKIDKNNLFSRIISKIKNLFNKEGK